MDKQNNKNTITIKIDGEKKEYDDENLLVHNWQLGSEESAAAEEKVEEDQFDWILPDEENDPLPKEYKKINYVQTSPKVKKSMLPKLKGSSKIFVSLAGAIVVGVLLGLITLKVITHTDQAATPAIAIQEETSADTSASGEEAPAGNSSAFQTPVFTIPVLQAGVFSTLESRQAMEDTLEAKGLPTAALDFDGKQFLFVGVSGNLESAKQIGEKYKGSNVEVYAKELAFESKSIDVTEQEKQFLEQVTSIYSLVAQESANGIMMGNANTSVLDSIDKQMTEVNNLKVTEPTLVEMKNILVTNMETLKSMSNEQQATEIQSSLLQFLVLYNQL